MDVTISLEHKEVRTTVYVKVQPLLLSEATSDPIVSDH